MNDVEEFFVRRMEDTKKMTRKIEAGNKPIAKK